MGRTARDKRPYIPPVQKIELNARHTKVRLALAVLFFALGIGLIVFSLNSRLTADAGWAEIEVEGGEISCAEDFTLLYPLGTTASPTAERKSLVALYTDACETAYRLFTNDAEFDGIANLRYLNAHPNEELPLDPALYATFEQIANHGDRSLYLAPILEVYGNIFSCADPAQTAEFDPRKSAELREWFARVCAFANDPAQVNLELLGDNRARLFVSEEYLAFARAEEIESFIDFGWMRNAFIADYIAGRLTGAGYSIGALSSIDGFMRNLDEGSDSDYAVSIPGYDAGRAFAAATLHYRGARAIVSLRNFPASDAELSRYAILPDGNFATAYLDPSDGLCKSALPSLVACSETAGCAEIALSAAPVYIADSFSEEALAGLSREGIESVYPVDGEIRHTEANIELSDLAEGFSDAAPAP